jgi:hypothetical protein
VLPALGLLPFCETPTLNLNIKMEHLRLASPSDDLYSGYNDYPSAFSTKDLDQDEILQQALRTSYGRRPVVSCRIVL